MTLSQNRLNDLYNTILQKLSKDFTTIMMPNENESYQKEENPKKEEEIENKYEENLYKNQ